ncbi:MAG: phosphoribosylamine--glycine ligase [Oscillatoriaceae bacterium SKW80]|nr:phosphoribosylamine--glycine ligase [Oscillatoriaceae bacterium SKYG93]MCX8121824.1 phosphoribosylamine--glycine ligase [Oscillatoriaceae bacterium SKW80]MDW8454584.1 phosphoribosylamine--glycine ligase [Oscillatoriaceae cyanobacterium SKYGB_i_bin93]HIK27398.1 phosphoribosylamine--glycine ligase [Oscillatoriaceae cyanobacterium M7585_C2015_266]
MKVLVIGNGGREHALAWKLLQSPQVEQVFVAPGNGGTAVMERCQNLPLSVDNFDGIKEAVWERGIDLVAIGPELPLAMGIVDYLEQNGIAVFGPSQTGAQIEASKSWAKGIMREAKIPTATAAVFTDDEFDAAVAYVRKQGAPIVVKADGLAAGKGVTVAKTEEEAIAAIKESFNGKFGIAGECVVIEEFLTGEEVSVLALIDGETVLPLLPAQDHKAVGEGDTGPNTGGMGAYAPAPLVTPELMEQILQKVFQPVITLFRSWKIDYRGVLYAGLMILPSNEIKVLEFNCRFGDPETQVILPLLETPLADLMLACVQRRLASLPPLRWQPGVAASVVVAAGGYPGSYRKGDAIAGIERAEALGAIVFHAGTKLQDGLVLTDGGRVLNITTTAPTFDEAFARAYAAVDCIQFPDCFCRRDIGYRVRSAF